MHRFLLFAGVCIWLVALVGCGGDDSTPVASNDNASSGGYEHGEESTDEHGETSTDEHAEESTDEHAEESTDEHAEESTDEHAEESTDEHAEESTDEHAEESTDEHAEESTDEHAEEGGYAEGEYEEGYMDEEGAGSRDGEEGEHSGTASPPRPLTLADKSKAAFAGGQEKEAFQYMFAYAVTADDAAAKEMLDKMGLLVPAKRPSMAVRWGVGIEYTTEPRNYEGNAYPIGTNQQLNAGNRSGGGGYGESGGGGGYDEEGYGAGGASGYGPSGRAMDDQLKKLTGELGERFVGGLRDRIAAGVFGKVLAEAMAGGLRQRPNSSGRSYSGGEEEGYMEEGYEEEGDSALATENRQKAVKVTVVDIVAVTAAVTVAVTAAKRKKRRSPTSRKPTNRHN